MVDTCMVVNQTKGTQLVSALSRADNPWSRFWGLMGKPGLAEGKGLWIEPCSDIHSCFMRFEFDAVFVNKQLVVVDTIESMKPWRLKFAKGGRSVFELPAGTIAKTKTEVGDQLEVK